MQNYTTYDRFKSNDTIVKFDSLDSMDVIFVNTYRRRHSEEFKFELIPDSYGDHIAKWIMRVVLCMIISFCLLNIFNGVVAFHGEGVDDYK